MGRRLLFILVICGIHITALSQQQKATDPQKLLSLIANHEPDTIYIEWLLELSNYYSQQKSGVDSSLLFASRAEESSLKLNYPKGLGNSYIAMSKLLRKTQPGKSKDYINKSIKIFSDARHFTDLGFAYWELSGYYAVSSDEYAEKLSLIEKSVRSFHKAGNIKKEADALKELADIRQINGGYVQSLEELKKALKLYQSINEPMLQGIYDLMGDVSCSLGNLNDAVRYGLLAFETAEKVKDTSLQLCTICNHLGITYYYLKDYNSSAAYYQKALEIAEKFKAYDQIYLITYNYGNNLKKMNKPAECNQLLSSILQKYPGIDTSLLIHYLSSFITNHTLLKQYSQAGKYFDQMTFIVKGRQLNHETQRGVYLASIRYLVASGQNEKARRYLKAEEKYLTEKATLIQLAGNQLSWIDLDSAVGDYKSAFQHFRKYTALKDSIYSQERSKYIEQLNIQFETAKKDREILLKEKNIELLQQEAKIQHGELLQANQTRNWILAAIALLAVIIGLLVNNGRLKQRTNRKLTAQREEIENKNQGA